MKRKQQFLKLASIFQHNHHQKPYNDANLIWKELEIKAIDCAYDFTDNMFFDFEKTEKIPKEQITKEQITYYAMLNKHYTRRLIRRGEISRYGNRKYLKHKCNLRELKRYLKKKKAIYIKQQKLIIKKRGKNNENIFILH